MSDDLSVRMTLLDAQIVDEDRLPIGRVDDLELRVPADGRPPQIARVLTGSQALGERIRGPIGRWMASTAERLQPSGAQPGPAAFDVGLISETKPMVRLSVKADALEGVAGLEHWLAERFVRRLPGTRDEDE